MRVVILLAAFAILPSINTAVAQDNREIALVKAVFAQVQPISFRQNREYCGYIVRDENGQLQATSATRGRRDSCASEFPEDLDVIASYHTHGAYDPGAWAEIPSGDDMEGDEADGIDGWVATPGGRLWYIDSQDMVTSQICGLGCLPQAANYSAEGDGDIQASYTYDELVVKLAE